MSAYEGYRRLLEASGKDVDGSLLDLWPILVPLAGTIFLVGFVIRAIAIRYDDDLEGRR